MIDVSETFWNGQPCKARKVAVIVGVSGAPQAWSNYLVGRVREAVEITYQGQVFYIDNEDDPGHVDHVAGCGWQKVTEGRGSPRCYHASLPIIRVLDPTEHAQRIGRGEL